MSAVEYPRQDLYLLGLCEKLRMIAACDHSNWAERMGLTLQQYSQTYRQGRLPPPEAITRLAFSLGLSPDQFWTGQIDFVAFARQQGGDLIYIPEKFAKCARSKKRTVINILDYIEKRNLASKSYLLRRFQIHEAALVDPEEHVNIRLVLAVLDYLKGAGLSLYSFFGLGAGTIENNRQGLKKVFAGARTQPELLRRLAGDMSFFEDNFKYRIFKLTDKGCTIEQQASERVLDELKEKNIAPEEACAYKAGAISSLPLAIDLPAFKVDYAWSADSNCRFEVEFTQPSSRLA